MTVLTTGSSVEYTGNGATTIWPWLGFRIDSADDLQVVLVEIATDIETVVNPVDYTATGYGLDAGGSVTYPLVGSPLAATHRIVIQRVVPYEQHLDILNQGGFLPDIAEAQLDRMVMGMQQLSRQVAILAEGSVLAGGSFLPLSGGVITGDVEMSGADFIFDSGYYMTLNGNIPEINFHTNAGARDYISYDRVNRELNFAFDDDVAFTFGDFYSYIFGKIFVFDGINFDPNSGAPNAPANGDVWYEAANNFLWVRTNGVSASIPNQDRSMSYNAGKKQTFVPDATTAGLRITAGAAPSGPSTGDLWITTEGMYSRINSQNVMFDAKQFMSLTAAYVLANQTAAQKAFNVPANGAFNAKAATAYEFEGFISLSGMSASSGSFGFAMGGTATLTSIEWDSVGNKAALATAAAPQSTANVTAANIAIVTATTNTVGWMRIKGVVRVNAAGTLIPQVSLGVAAAATVGVDSFFKFTPIGVNTVTTQGDIA